jgi:hypothetical protein
VGIHKKGLSKEERGASEEWMGERFGIEKNYHGDIEFCFLSGMFKMLARSVDLAFEEFKGRKNGYGLHSRKNYRTLIGR